MTTPIQADPVVKNQLEQHGITEKTGVYGDHKVQIGKNAPIKLDSIKANHIPFQGFSAATRVDRGKEGLAASARHTLDVLLRPGTLDAGKLLSALKTNLEYLTRLIDLNALAKEQRQDWLWTFAPAVESLSNAELAALYQSFTTAEMDLVQTALKREGLINPNAGDASSASAQLFDLQALVLKEMSNRVSNGILDDLSAKEPDKAEEYNSMRPGSLSLQYWREESTAKEHEHDITAANLHTLANVAAESATLRERTSAEEQQMLTSHGISATPSEMGDVLRQSELTINVDIGLLMSDTSFVTHPDEPYTTIFHLHDQGEHPKGEGYVEERDSVETLLFPELAGHDAIADERPVYGSLNVSGQNLSNASQGYGSCSIILRPEVARRATFVVDDTFYSPSLSITPERRTNFYALLEGSRLPAQTIATLRDPNSAEHRALEAWFNEGARIGGWNAEEFRNIPQSVKDLLTGADRNASQDNTSRFSAVMLLAFGDAAATRARTATYDNLESLLPGLTPLDGASLARAAENRAAGASPSFSLAGARYIEAQIHGPLIASRDIQEVRVDLDPMSQVERMQLIQRMEEFSRQTGVKVVYLTSRGLDSAVAQSIQEGSIVQMETVSDQMLRHTGMAQAERRYFNEHFRQDIERSMADILEHIQDHLRSFSKELGLKTFSDEGDILGGATLDRLRQNILKNLDDYFKREIRQSTSPEDIAFSAFASEARKILTEKSALLAKLDELPLTSAQKKMFSTWIRTSQVRTPQELQFIFDNAQRQATALRTIVESDPPLSEAEAFHTLAEAAMQSRASITAYAHTLQGVEYGEDNIQGDGNRFSFLACDLLEGGEPPLTDEQWLVLYTRLNALRPLHENLAQIIFSGPAEGGETVRDDITNAMATVQMMDNHLRNVVNVRPLQRLNTLYGHLQQAINAATENAGGDGIRAWQIIGNYMNQNVPPAANTQDGEARGWQASLNLMTNHRASLEALHQHVGPRFGLTAEASLVPQSHRDIFRREIPLAMARFDANHPAYAPFPSAAVPGNMPATHEDRRNFLINHLDAYLNHERQFDPSAIHGRGHIVRSYIFASALCSILEEQNVPVDRNAVLCGITGHDIGRQGNGTDRWEGASAAATVNAMREAYGASAMGGAYEQAVTAGITHDSTTVDTVEGLLIQSADSLDIVRLGLVFDFSRLSFLHGRNGERPCPAAQRLREGLVREAEQLNYLCNPVVRQGTAWRDLEERIGETATRGDYAAASTLMAQREALARLIEGDVQAQGMLPPADFVTYIENLVRDNPQIFPILSRYYR